ncbi:MAG: hypothetical protein SGI89_15055 [bacterium]|nr:hypothetical protein [bacterium]
MMKCLGFVSGIPELACTKSTSVLAILLCRRSGMTMCGNRLQEVYFCLCNIAMQAVGNDKVLDSPAQSLLLS